MLKFQERNRKESLKGNRNLTRFHVRMCYFELNMPRHYTLQSNCPRMRRPRVNQVPRSGGPRAGARTSRVAEPTFEPGTLTADLLRSPALAWPFGRYPSGLRKSVPASVFWSLPIALGTVRADSGIHITLSHRNPVLRTAPVLTMF